MNNELKNGLVESLDNCECANDDCDQCIMVRRLLDTMEAKEAQRNSTRTLQAERDDLRTRLARVCKERDNLLDADVVGANKLLDEALSAMTNSDGTYSNLFSVVSSLKGKYKLKTTVDPQVIDANELRDEAARAIESVSKAADYLLQAIVKARAEKDKLIAAGIEAAGIRIKKGSTGW